MTKSTKERNLGAELFDLVEREQGYAFVSDAISGLPKDRVLNIARGALKHTEITAAKLRSFIAKYETVPSAKVRDRNNQT